MNLESVGGEPENPKGNTIPSNEEPPSPDNTYSSIASAFKVDGVPLFSEADDEELKKISSVEDFEDFLKERLEKAIDDRFDDSQKRIKDALTYGMEPSDIQVFENSLRNQPDTIKNGGVKAPKSMSAEEVAKQERGEE